MGCLLDVVVTVVLFVVVGLIAGEAHSSNGSYSVNLTTVPTVIFVGVLLAYYFGVSRPRRRDRRRQ